MDLFSLFYINLPCIFIIIPKRVAALIIVFILLFNCLLFLNFSALKFSNLIDLNHCGYFILLNNDLLFLNRDLRHQF